jgi:hypothetical protein
MNLKAAAIRIILRIVGSNEADSASKLRWRRILSTATASFAARGLIVISCNLGNLRYIGLLPIGKQ